ncbi:hypothetical protein BDB00DRAFT_469601 [Zychaea mexicana]|uniref:uncharacterized protein n=1 Tax=Zychaea mexicana TaxID=64656 RepID=UPI0022FEF42B|nr:uncharacterized protein BDB00DRAFT_469601 [Zychaea mexicana]KAI9491901.1 hypothetical protein BDB00DRAFT_469601 [Zychaea mexicana]
MSGNGSDSSEDEWVTSTVIEPAKSKTKTTTTSFFRSNSNYNHIPTTTSSAIFATSTASISTSTTSSSSTSTINISRTATPTAKRLAVSDATIRTIKANLPKSSTQKAQDQAAYITPQDLEQFCQTADSPSFIQKLVETYKSAETYLRIREIETSKLTIDVRLSECLQECPDPGAFVLVRRTYM